MCLQLVVLLIKPISTESWALMQGLKSTSLHNFRSIWVHFDAQLVIINYAKGSLKSMVFMFFWFQTFEISCHISQFPKYSFIPRLQNQLAHNLANYGRTHQFYCFGTLVVLHASILGMKSLDLGLIRTKINWLNNSNRYRRVETNNFDFKLIK